jgi:hypothetical protein
MAALAAPDGDTGMAYREKLAWLNLATLLLYPIYFAKVPASADLGPHQILYGLGWFAAVSIARLVVLGVGGLVLRRQTRASDRGKPDERDRAITHRGGAIAYGVMMAGFIMVGVMMPFVAQGWKIVNAALFAILIAEAVRLLTVILSYRRGWHG